MSVYAEDILSKVSDHDMAVIKVLNERDSGFTKIQIAKKLKRSLEDVSHSIHRLKVSKHVKDSRYYGRVYLVDFDYSEQIANKRPDEAAMKIKQLQQDKAELVNWLKVISDDIECYGEMLEINKVKLIKFMEKYKC